MQTKIWSIMGKSVVSFKIVILHATTVTAQEDSHQQSLVLGVGKQSDQSIIYTYCVCPNDLTTYIGSYVI